MSDAIVKNLSFGYEAKDQLFEGINKLTKAVSSTLGASGKRVILEDAGGKPVITKDGVTVADSIVLLDPIENMGATLLKEAARKTVKEAGDGTTTATVLAHSILTQAYPQLEELGARDLKKGIDNAVNKVIDYLEKNSIKVTGQMIDQVASISTNNDKVLGAVIAQAFRSVDETGVVMMEATELSKTTSELVEGIQYNKGLTNSHFVTKAETRVAELDNPLVLLIESPVENVRKIQNILEHAIKSNKSLLIIADLDPKVISTLAMNKIKNVVKVNVINAPTYGVTKKDMLTDLALLTGATIINEDLGDDMDMILPEYLGTCLKSITNDTETILKVESISDEVKEIVKTIKKDLNKNNTAPEVIRLEKRLARLSAKIATVKVGADSSIELKEKTDRVEDAICATKAAIKEGIVAGGGVALLNAAMFIKPKNKAESILLEAIKAPYHTILDNANISEAHPEKKGWGLDVITGKSVKMVKAGIIDPLLVTKAALRNAASVATTILSTDCIINNLRINEGNR
jgi:chaperonin GroEL